MSRLHSTLIALVLGSVVVAGFFAAAKTVRLGQKSPPPSTPSRYGSSPSGRRSSTAGAGACARSGQSARRRFPRFRSSRRSPRRKPPRRRRRPRRRPPRRRSLRSGTSGPKPVVKYQRAAGKSKTTAAPSRQSWSDDDAADRKSDRPTTAHRRAGTTEHGVPRAPPVRRGRHPARLRRPLGCDRREALGKRHRPSRAGPATRGSQRPAASPRARGPAREANPRPALARVPPASPAAAGADQEARAAPRRGRGRRGPQAGAASTYVSASGGAPAGSSTARVVTLPPQVKVVTLPPAAAPATSSGSSHP